MQQVCCDHSMRHLLGLGPQQSFMLWHGNSDDCLDSLSGPIILAQHSASQLATAQEVNKHSITPHMFLPSSKACTCITTFFFVAVNSQEYYHPSCGCSQTVAAGLCKPIYTNETLLVNGALPLLGGTWQWGTLAVQRIACSTTHAN